MSRAESICAVILAAGFSTRMGREKALLPWPPVAEGTPAVNTFLGTWIDLLQQHADLVIVVAGHNAAALKPVIYAHGGFLALNHHPEHEQFSSVQVGLQDVLNRGRDAAILAPVDRPPVLPGTVHHLRHALLSAAPEIWAVVPEIESQGQVVHGHPIVVGREMIEDFLRAPVTANARDIMHEHHEHVLYLRGEDQRIAMNIDTPEDYERLRNTELISTGSVF